jgi:alkylation response protein AidB-like acyl-CoA dehydrogenase
MVAGTAAIKFQQDLIKEQEVMAKVADMVIQIFAMESGLLRTLKIIAREGEEKARYHIAAVKVYVDEAIPKIQALAKQAMAHMEEGDNLLIQLAGIEKLAQYQPVDAVSLRRQVADRIIDLEAYPF